jgi:hypothetical protein
MSRYGYMAFNIFQVCSTSLFTGGTFYSNLNNFHEYLIQHSLKSGGTKDHITSNVKSIDVWRSNVVNMLQTTHLDLLIKLFYLYQRLQCTDNYFFRIKFVLFTAACQHRERKTICLDIFLLSNRQCQWGTEHQYFLAVFLAFPYYNYL